MHGTGLASIWPAHLFAAGAGERGASHSALLLYPLPEDEPMVANVSGREGKRVRDQRRKLDQMRLWRLLVGAEWQPAGGGADVADGRGKGVGDG